MLILGNQPPFQKKRCFLLDDEKPLPIYKKMATFWFFFIGKNTKQKIVKLLTTNL